MKRIAVLMTCFNRVETTLQCLRGLFAQKTPPGFSFDVWLVDDASPDRTGEKVKSAYPQVNVIQSSGNLFWCKGMRLAWDTAAGTCDYDFYLWLNDDSYLYSHALQTVCSDYETLGGGRVIVGAFCSEEDSTRVSYSCRDIANRDITPNGVAPQKGYHVFGGNFVLIPREVVNVVGRISNDYHHAYGDFDYARRLTRAGFEFYATSQFVGACSTHAAVYPLKGMAFMKRVKLLWRPNGYHVGDAFLYRRRHNGLFRAILSVAHVVFKVLRGK